MRTAERTIKPHQRFGEQSTAVCDWGIDLHQAASGLDQRPHPAAKRDVLGQHCFRAFKRELGLFDALLGIIGRHPVAVGFHIVHGFPTHGGRYRSLKSGETGAA